MLLIAKSTPNMHSLTNCAMFTRKVSFLKRSHTPRMATASRYLIDSIVSTDTPIERSGFANKGLRPYVTPVIIPAA